MRLSESDMGSLVFAVARSVDIGLLFHVVRNENVPFEQSQTYQQVYAVRHKVRPGNRLHKSSICAYELLVVVSRQLRAPVVI